METDSLTAVTPIDGRYAGKTEQLRRIFSEFALMRYRLEVEIRWFLALASNPDIRELPPPGAAATRHLEALAQNFSMEDARRIKAIEATTNHDVKAIEYFIREKVAELPDLAKKVGFFHFACTSEDINNISHALMLSEAREQVLMPEINSIITVLARLTGEHAARPMLSRTHGQTASPSTMGKELGVFAHRLRRQLESLTAVRILGKMNGAVGNYNAHMAAYPDIDWPGVAKGFVESLNLDWNPHTTQIESHDYMAEYLHALCRVNSILIDLCRDIWGYISLGYFRQKPIAGEIGSSTMPHKVNPIDFENAEGNLGVANSLMQHLAEKLPVSRWQRDLSDSTAIRSIGTAIAHSHIAYQSCLKGLGKLEIAPQRLAADLEDAWEVLAEALQTVMRRHGIENAYEKLKELTRGKAADRQSILDFIRNCELPEHERQRLMALSPAEYCGNAFLQANEISGTGTTDGA